MEVRNCPRCGRIFNVVGNARICDSCKKENEKKFQEVRAYVEEHKNVPVEKVAKENEVSMKQIRQWIKEERLVLSDPMLSGVTCEKCGKPICTGKFCDRCRNSIAGKLMNAFNRPNKEEPEVKKSGHDQKMRYLND